MSAIWNEGHLWRGPKAQGDGVDGIDLSLHARAVTVSDTNFVTYWQL
jgi:hypothetical protein